MPCPTVIAYTVRPMMTEVVSSSSLKIGSVWFEDTMVRSRLRTWLLWLAFVMATGLTEGRGCKVSVITLAIAPSLADGKLGQVIWVGFS